MLNRYMYTCILERGPTYTLVVSTTGVRRCNPEDSCATSQDPESLVQIWTATVNVLSGV